MLKRTPREAIFTDRCLRSPHAGTRRSRHDPMDIYPTAVSDLESSRSGAIAERAPSRASRGSRHTPLSKPTKTVAGKRFSWITIRGVRSRSNMSFRPCRFSSNEDLVDNLKKTHGIQSDEVVAAMKRTDRAKYMAQMETPDGEPVGPLSAYSDSPHPIGFNQTISAPHMHGYAMELCLNAVKDINKPRILDVGAGSGYLLACFGRLAEPRNGIVFGLEILPGLAQFARKNLQSADSDLTERGVVSLHCGNGWDGLPNEAPFHFIHVGAAAETPPRALMDQLADGGRLVVPVNEQRGGQMLVEITRDGSNYSQRKLMAVWYVPLVRERKMSM